MKRFIAAVSLAVLANSAFAAENGKPFEQLDVDRALPNIPERAPEPIAYPYGGSAPYEQLAVDRALPSLPEDRTMFAAAGGDTRSDLEIATEERAESQPESPWANDQHFVAPPQ
jgi:hypothetical protein